jgi:multiple sugar transport system substrate-binding protein
MSTIGFHGRSGFEGIGLMRRLRLRDAWVVLAGVCVGCGSPESGKQAPSKPTFQGAKLVAGLVGNEALLPGLRSQQGEWSAATGAELSVREADLKAIQGLDVLVFPGDQLGDLIDKGVLLVLPDASLKPPAVVEPKGNDNATPEPPPDAFDLRDIAPAFRDQVAKYGDDRYALPLGGTALVLAFRRDAFDSDANKAAATAAGVSLEPPKTWEELDALARFFHGRDWSGDGKPDSGIALAWGTDPEGVADATFLARAASLGQHRDQYSFLFSDRMAPRIASPPFVEALQGLIGLAKSAPSDALKSDIETARAAFRSGKVALLIDRAERASTWSEGKPIGVAPLPGSARVYNPDRKAWEPQGKPSTPAFLPRGGGWLVGVLAATSNRDAAIDLAKYLAGPDVTNRLRSDRAFPMLATRNTQLGQGLGDPRSAPGVEPRAWSDSVSRTINAPRVIVGPRIPDADGYLADLTKGRLAAANGQPAEAALKAVADAWNARTEAFGLDRQIWHYRRSLNNFVTAPEPPPRAK